VVRQLRPSSDAAFAAFALSRHSEVAEMMRFQRSMAVCALLLLAGCGGTDLTVESDTSWGGTIDGIGTLEESGSKSYSLSTGRQRVCWSLSKRTEAGVLRVYTEQSTWFGLGNNVDFDVSTSALGTTISGCSS
jgi:hypothetical protein